MAFSYNASLNTATSRVRQLLGDTSTPKHEVEDETIAAYLATTRSELATAAQLAEDLAAKYARAVDTTHDHQSTYASQAMQQYLKLAERLRARMAASPGATSSGFSGVFVGGIDDCRTPIDMVCPSCP